MATCNSRIFFLSALLLSISTKISAQVIHRIPVISIPVKPAIPQLVFNTINSDSIRKMPFRYSPPADWANSHQEPLYVIDNKIDVNRRKLNRIDPYDIENINVIKSDRAIPLYGQRGINGVIVITTKKHRSTK